MSFNDDILLTQQEFHDAWFVFTDGSSQGNLADPTAKAAWAWAVVRHDATFPLPIDSVVVLPNPLTKPHDLFTWFAPPYMQMHESNCGLVVNDPDHPQFLGASAISNITAELSAMMHALQMLIDKRPVRAILAYDSIYVGRSLQHQGTVADTNLAIVERGRELLQRVQEHTQVRFWKVPAHSKFHFNNRVDRIAFHMRKQDPSPQRGRA